MADLVCPACSRRALPEKWKRADGALWRIVCPHCAGDFDITDVRMTLTDSDPTAG